MTEKHKRKVYVLGSDCAQRRNLVDLLTVDSRHEAHEFESSGQLLAAAEAAAPGCAVVDVTPVWADELDLIGVLLERHPRVPIVLVTRAPALAGVLDAARRGSVAFCTLNGRSDSEGLLGAVDMACASAEVSTSDILGEMARTDVLEKLSPREREVLKLLLGGQQNKGIAHTLGISPRTVEVHRSRMMRRLGVASFAELIRLAVEAGLHSES